MTIDSDPSPAAADGAGESSPSDAPRGRLALPIAVIALVLGLAAGFGGALLLGGAEDTSSPEPVDVAGETRDGDPEARADLPPVDTGLTPADATNPETALRAFLAAEATGDWETSYELIAPGVVENTYPSQALWVNSHADFPRVTAYRIDQVEQLDEDTARVETLTGFEPMLDPVIGLVPARGRTTWTMVRAGDGRWTVDVGVTENRPLYPSSDGVEVAAQQWVDQRVACADTTALEADLVGSPALANALCEEAQPDTVEVGAARSLSDADGTTALLSEFGPEVFTWARVVPVDATTPLLLVLGPVGESWQVVGVLLRT